MISSLFWVKYTKIFVGVSFFAGLLFFGGLHVVRSQTTSCPLPILVPYKTPQSASVYYISEDCKKRPIKDPAVYFSHFSSWKEVRLTTAATLNRVPNHELSFLPWGPRRIYQNGSLIKTVDDPKVYLVLDGIRIYPIESETVFRGILGYQFNQIEDVTSNVIERYIVQPSITSVDSIPPTLIFKYPEDPKVYSLERSLTTGELSKRYMESVSQIAQNNFRADRIATIPTARFFVEATGVAPVVRPLPAPVPPPSPNPTPTTPIPSPIQIVPVPVPVPVPTPVTPTPNPNPTTNVLPVVSLSTPSQGASFTSPASITILASASDSDGFVSYVEFLSGTSVVGIDTTAPYSFTWAVSAPGTYPISARAVDNTGAQNTTAAVSITVSSVTSPSPTPTVPSPSPSSALIADPTLSDEFNTASTLSNWSQLNSDLATTINIGSNVAGRLTAVAAPFFNNGWYGDNQGPLIYKNVTGDFVIEVYAREGRIDDVTAQPSGTFKQVGIVVKNPVSPARQIGTATTLVLPAGQQNWIMYNMGMLLSQFGREVKTTRAGNPESLSTLFMNDNPAGVRTARMRVCRVGSNFYFYHRFDNQADWTEEVLQSSTVVMGNGSSLPTPGLTSNAIGTPLRFIRTDLPQTVQVGLIASNWDSPYNGRADFDYARFAAVSTQGDCIRDLPAAGTSGTPSPSPSAPSFLPAISGFGDEFADANSLSQWSNRQTVEGGTNQISTLNVNTSAAGALSLTPASNAGWFNTSAGPFIYKNITGDFVVTTQVSAHSLSSVNQAPSQLSNAAGLLVRTPSSASGVQNWITNNIGTHSGAVVGSTNLNTVNGVSNSVIAQAGSFNQALRICRVGSTVYTFISQDNEQTWTLTNTFTRTDFPSTVQVGMMAVAASSIGDVRADFSYIRAATPSSASDCTGMIAPAVATGISPSPPPPPPPPPSNPNPAPSPTPVSAISGFGDEFADASTLSQWSNRQTVEGGTSQLNVWDINASASGAMVLTPSQGNIPWYNSSVGPFVYKQISGDFVVTTQVLARSLNSANQGPGQQYNAAGLLVRNPSSASGVQNWVTNNVGNTSGTMGATNINTTNSASGALSVQTTSFSAALRICRIGSTIRTYVSQDNEQTWTLTNTFTRADFPSTLQVGMMAVAASSGNDMRAEFSYIRAALPSSVNDCTGTLVQAITNPSPSPTPPPPPPPPPPTTPPPTPSPTPISGFSDEFTNSGTISNWTSRQVVEGGVNQIATWNINSTVPGNMVLIPASNNVAWYNGLVGPFIYKNVTGDFVISLRVNAHSFINPASAPGQIYNAGGLLVRNPASVSGAQNWIEMAVGNHESANGLVTVNTINSAAPNLAPIAGVTNTSIRICRIGSVFRLYTSADNEQTWDQSASFTRSDLPSTLQVGMVVVAANASGNPDIQADFDYIRGIVPTSVSDCTMAIGS
jgi:regulation of enolase protein 1 (concanavalin A-like superfamily)